MSGELTRYGPGKFNLLVDVLAYNASLDGADAFAGDVTENGEHYSVVFGPIEPTAEDVKDIALSDADRAFLAEQKGGAIVRENSDGFVSVEWFATQEDVSAAWARQEAKGFGVKS